MLFCPNCGSEKVLPSVRQSWWRGVQESLGLRHYLCDECFHRFTVRGNQGDEPALRRPGLLAEAAGEPYPSDGPIYLESTDRSPLVEAQPQARETPASSQEWPTTGDQGSGAGPDFEPSPGFGPDLVSPARATPEPEQELEPGLDPEKGLGQGPRGLGLHGLQPGLDFAGPGLEREPGFTAPPRPTPPLLSLWRKLGLGLGLVFVCVALLLWYRLNLDSSPESHPPTPAASPTIREEPLKLAPTPAPSSAEGAQPMEKPGPAVGAIPPPANEATSQRGPAQPWSEPPSSPPPAIQAPPAPRLDDPPPAPAAPLSTTPSARPRAREDQPAVAVARPTTPRATPTQAAPAKPAKAPSKVKTNGAAGGYTLQFGAFSDQDRAMALADKLKGMGFKVDLVQGAASNGRVLTKVRSGHFASPQEARQARTKAAALTAMEVVVVPPPRR